MFDVSVWVGHPDRSAHSSKTNVSGTVAVSVDCSTLQHCQKETGCAGGSRETRDPAAFFTWHLFFGMMLYWILGIEARLEAATIMKQRHAVCFCVLTSPGVTGMNSTCQCQCCISIELQDDRFLFSISARTPASDNLNPIAHLWPQLSDKHLRICVLAAAVCSFQAPFSILTCDGCHAGKKEA